MPLCSPSPAAYGIAWLGHSRVVGGLPNGTDELPATRSGQYETKATMRKLLSGALALTLTLALGACGTLEDAFMSPAPTAVPRADTTAVDAATATPTATTASRAVDQATPEAAMESWLAALVAGDGVAVCALMAADGQPVDSIEGAAPDCGEALTPLLSSLQELRGMFDGLSIDGATVIDDLATFEAATVKPDVAAQVIHRFKAVKIKDKWFVTE